MKQKRKQMKKEGKSTVIPEDDIDKVICVILNMGSFLIVQIA